MNIYTIFRKASNRGTLTRKKLTDIWQTHCPRVPFALMEAHRKIYHQQLWLNYWHPVNRFAPEAEYGNYIDLYGNIKDTDTRTRTGGSWSYHGTYALRDPGNKSALAHKYRRNKEFADILDIFNDRTLHPQFINDHTLPKWEPRSNTLCLDPRSEFNKSVERMLNYNVLVLRCTPLENDQYDLWTISRRTRTLKRHVATIVGTSIGLGKSKHGSKRSGFIKNAKQITKHLDT